MKRLPKLLSLASLWAFTFLFNISPSLTLAGDPKIKTYGGTSINGFLEMIRNWIFGFSGALAVLFIILGGFKIMTAAGNEKQLTSGKKTLTYAIIGLVVILLFQVILNLIAGDVLGSIFKNVGSSPYDN